MHKNNKEISLTDEYTPLEYIQYTPKLRPKLYAIKGFKTSNEAVQFAKKLEITEQVHIGLNPSCGWVIEFEELILKKIEKFIHNGLQLCRTSYPTTNSFYIPHIYRYMPKKYIDKFFTDGSLRLGSFSKFKNLENKNLKDNKEGTVELNIEATNGLSMKTNIGFGDTSFILCCSLKNDTDMYDYYKSDSILVINNIMAFSEEITKVLKENYAYEVLECISGPCEYIQERTIQSFGGSSSEKDLNMEFGINKENINWDTMLAGCYKHCGKRPLFLKPNQFCKEVEYRIAWQIESYSIPEIIDLKVPNAIKYCSHI